MPEPRYYSTRKPYATHPQRKGLFNFLRWAVRLFTHSHRMAWKTAEPREPEIFVCNYARAYGPIAIGTYFSRPFRPWVVGEICDWGTAPQYMRDWFFFPKNAFMKGVFWLLSYLLTPVAVVVMNGAEAIPVFHDKRVLTTLNKSLQTLDEGKDIVVFPENSEAFSSFHNQFSVGFIQTARRYYRKTKRRLAFYPTFCCKETRVISVGQPLFYDPDMPMDKQCQFIADHLADEMTALAAEQERLYGKPFQGDTYMYRTEDAEEMVRQREAAQQQDRGLGE